MPILYFLPSHSKAPSGKSDFKLDPRVRVNEPLGFNDYNKLQMNALAIVSDSGTLPEEQLLSVRRSSHRCRYCIRTSTERPRHWKLVTSFSLALPRELLNATDMAIEMEAEGRSKASPVLTMWTRTVSMKVVRIIQGLCKRGQ